MGQRETRPQGRRIIRAVLLFVLVFGGVLGSALIWHPASPLPPGWNPAAPLRVADPVTPLTNWKLRRTTADPALCETALRDAAGIAATGSIPSDDPNCGVARSHTLSRVGGVALSVETACPTALRTAMWERHGLQPAAERHLQSLVTRIEDQGSYNCRPIRTGTGNGRRYSTHATAMALDVRGFQLADGRRLSLLRDWDGASEAASFLRDARDSACRWFVTVLGPDYNALHADHFHLQATGWGTCR